MSQGRGDMASDDVGVVLERRLLYGAAHRFVDPAFEIGSQRFVVAIEHQPSYPIRDGLREFLRYLLARLAVDVLALRTIHGVHDVAGHPTAVLALRYRPLAVPALLAQSRFPFIHVNYAIRYQYI